MVGRDEQHCDGGHIRLSNWRGVHHLQRRWAVRPVLALANGSTVKLTNEGARLAGINNEYLLLDEDSPEGGSQR